MTEERNPTAAIVPVEQKTIDFYGDDLVAVRDEEDTVWVPVRRLCEALGVSERGQMKRIQRDPVLNEELRSARVTRADGRIFEMACLPLKFVRAWLFGISANPVKPELREKLIQYHREVIEIIDRAFSRAPLKPASIDEAHMVAIRDLARQQAELWDAMIAERRRLDVVQELAEEHEGMIRHLEGRIEYLRRELTKGQAEITRRLTAMSDQLQLLPAPSETRITPEQKATIRGLIEDLVAAADAKGVKLWQRRNNYQSAYATLNRTFRLAKYQELMQAQYPKAVEWLERELAKIEER